MNKHIFLILLITLVSCRSEDVSDNLKPGLCVEEINLQYLPGAGKSQKYKVQSVGQKMIKLEVWNGRGWLFLGEKKKNYFNNSNKFNYLKTNCPDDNSGPQSISDTIQNIDIKN